MLRTSPLIVLLAFGCQFQASCGNKKIDPAKAQAFLERVLPTGVGEKPTAVKCPDDVKLEKDKTFECTATFGTHNATVVIKQTDDEGSVVVERINGVVVASQLEEAIAKDLGASKNVHVTAQCGARVQPLVAGNKIACTAKDAQQNAYNIEVLLKDAQGNYGWRIVP